MKLLTAGACLWFLAFAATRAAYVPFTYDEAASYIRYIDTSVASVFDTNWLSAFSFEVATNHFLNTLLTRFFYLVAGGGEFVLRLPNLLGYALYLCFAVLILRRVAHPAIAFCGLLLLNLNPYVLDFFALSRGYGLALGFLMGALFFLLRIAETRANAPDDVSRALVCGCAAVLANFALLNVYVSVLVVAVATLGIFNLTNGGSSALKGDRIGLRSRWSLLAGALIIPLVLSQDSRLAASLYEPAAVRLGGLTETALGRAKVLGIDLRGREFSLTRDTAAGWRSNRVALRGLRIEVPIEDAGSLERVETVIGTRVFPDGTSAWSSGQIGRTRVLESANVVALPRSRVPAFRSVINWAGDAHYSARLAITTAFGLAILVGFALGLRLIGWILIRAGILRLEEWRPMESSALWVAVLAGTPLYLLRRNSELYFGGTRGIIADTFHSIVESSFYGQRYSAAQIQIVFACVGVTVVMFCVLVAIGYRRRQLSILAPAISILAIVVTASLSLVVQRVMFQTVYLIGRTALFYVPLFVLFFVFVCDGTARLGRAGRVIGISAVAVALVLSGYHFAHTANQKYAFDWSDDASSRVMMDDLGQFIAASPQPSDVTLGVDPPYSPVAVYYARRNPAARVDVVTLPSSRPCDFLYVREREGQPRSVIGRYPATRTVLIRVGP